jgi:hypothetical protein
MPFVMIEITAADKSIGELALSIVVYQVRGFSATPTGQVAMARMRPNIASDCTFPVFLAPTRQLKVG